MSHLLPVIAAGLGRGACVSSRRAWSSRTLTRPAPRARQQPTGRTTRIPLVSARWHSAPTGLPQVYDFPKIKEISEAPSAERILIDVREPSEYQAGYIPSAVNIPLKSQPDAIFLPVEEFEDRFGFAKPDLENEVIFYCKSGVRSSAAAQLAQQQGYQKVSEYRGSWLDCEKNGGKVGT